jgi:putative membrane protein
VLLLRRGVIWRKLAVLPLARLQSLGVHQGPVDRRLRVASAHAHVISGPVYAQLAAIDRDEALDLFERVARGVTLAASGDHSHRWAEEATVDAPGPDSDSGRPS